MRGAFTLGPAVLRVARVLPVLPVLAALLGLSAFASAAHAQETEPPIVHMVRDGETLASIAQQYYGNPKRESVLVAENGLTSQGGGAIVVGLRLRVPTVRYYLVQEGDTWRTLAEKFYGRASRVSAILRANKGHPGRNPDIGAQLLIPYPLRHMAAQGENLATLAGLYYGNRKLSRVIRGFNNKRGNRLARGEIILVPMDKLVLTDEGRAKVQAATGVQRDTGEARKVQGDIEAQLPLLGEHVQHGRFEEAVALGNWLLGHGQITGNQELSIQRQLGTAYVALERDDLAAEAFRRALKRQPDLELDSARTSPRVTAALERARQPE